VRRLLRHATVLAVLAVVAAACAGADGDGNDGDRAGDGRVELRPSTTVAVADLYHPPSPLPGSAPGDLIAAEAIEPPPGAPAGARAWRVLYRSTGVDGSPVGVTGIVVAPPDSAPPDTAAPGPAAGRPVVTWAHGTTGVADVCAPSRRPTGSAWLAELLGRGFVIVATDYEGLGTPGVHPYLVGESAARSVLDAARVAAAFPDPSAVATGPVIVAGHSQGGHAALFAATLAGEYAPELPVAGVIAVAPPTDLPDMAAPFAGSPVLGGFVVTIAVGFAAAYPELDPADVLTPAGVALTDAVHEVCLDEVIARAVAAGEPIAVDDPLAVSAWARRVRENVPPPTPAGLPVLVLQGGRDPIVPAAITRQYAERACAGRSTIELAEYPDADHGAVLVAGRDDVLAWIEARLAGDRPARWCEG